MVNYEASDGQAPAELFASLHTLLLSVESIDAFLQDLAELATEAVSPKVSCGITTSYDHSPVTVASSDDRARTVDQAQYDTDEGPCLQAFRENEVVLARDTEQETRWPAYVSRAREAGLACSLSTPLVVEGNPVGAINLYNFDRPDRFGESEMRQAQEFADRASTALLLALRQAKSSETNRQLEEALASRSVIDQALGILMGQQRCDPDQAFDLLRAHSQNNNRKLRDVAADLVERTSGSALGPGRPFRRDGDG